MLAEYKIKMSPVEDDTPDVNARGLLDEAKSKMGFVPNMYRTMANSPGYLSTYMHGYQAFRESSGFTPQEQEVVFLVLSRLNQCDYCLAAHSMLADKVQKLDSEALEAVRAGGVMPDAKLEALAVFTARIFDARGLITIADAAEFLAAGFSEKQIMEVVLAISVKILSNYSNHIFHTEIDAPFTPYLPVS
jgi:uncharacterized peroxidase-related enzyme